MGKRYDLTGQKFGRLTVLYENGRKHAEIVWHCKCDCGNECDVLSSNLRNGKTQSCGCLQKERTSESRLIDLTGMTFGRLTVLKRMENKVKSDGSIIARWLCQCSCGNTCVVDSYSLRNTFTRSCGCLSIETKSKNGKLNKKYNSYDLESYEYGIGYTLKGEPFYFDKEDFDLIYPYCWHKLESGYLVANCGNNKSIYLHKLIMGVDDTSTQVDHIKHIKEDNRKSQLRIVTWSQNQMNKSLQQNNTTGYKGVSFDKKTGRYRARIMVNKKNIDLGYFDTAEEASQAYENASDKYHGEYSYKNSMKNEVA